MGEDVQSSTSPGGWKLEISDEQHYKLSLSVLQVTRYSTHSTSHRQHILNPERSQSKSPILPWHQVQSPALWVQCSRLHIKSEGDFSCCRHSWTQELFFQALYTVAEQGQSNCTKHSQCVNKENKRYVAGTNPIHSYHEIPLSRDGQDLLSCGVRMDTMFP